MPFNRDLFNNADTRRVGNAAMTIIDRLQHFRPHEQMHAAAVVFLVLAEHWGMSAQDAFTATKNLINGAEGKRPELAAVEQYVKEEL